MNKDFPASETKLLNLRQKGIFPKSSFLQRSVKFIFFILLIFFVLPKTFIVKDFAVFFENNLKFDYLSYILKVIFLPLAFLSLSFFVGFFQTRFFFSPEIAKVDFSRIHKSSLSSFKSLFYHLLFSALLVFFLFLTFYNSYQSYFLIKSETLAEGFYNYRDLLEGSSYRYLSYLLIFAFCSYFINWLLFNKQHKMTKSEIEAEQREQQSPRF